MTNHTDCYGIAHEPYRSIEQADLALTANAVGMSSQLPTPTITDPLPKRMRTGITPREVLAAHTVWLDGEQIERDCILADTVTGLVVQYKRNKFGLLQLYKGHYLTIRRFGTVEIKRK
jgi:hypothetical protein